MLAMLGCGSSKSETRGARTETSAPTTDRQAVAQAVNELNEAILNGDGSAACSGMTAEGQQTFVANFGQTDGIAPGGNALKERCVATIEGADFIPPLTGTVKPGAVTVLGGGRSASVQCDYGYLSATRVGDAWKVSLPVCSG
jgi:hypothetical protein